MPLYSINGIENFIIKCRVTLNPNIFSLDHKKHINSDVVI